MVKSDEGQPRTEMQRGFDEIHASFVHLNETLDLGFARQRSHLEAFVGERLDNQTRLVVFSIVGGLLTAAAIGIGAAAV